MMMMVAHNSLVRQKEGAQGEEEEKAGGRRKGGPTPRVDDPIGLTRSGVSDTRNRTKNMDGAEGFHSIGGAEGAWDQSYPLTIGVEGATEI